MGAVMRWVERFVQLTRGHVWCPHKTAGLYLKGFQPVRMCLELISVAISERP